MNQKQKENLRKVYKVWPCLTVWQLREHLFLTFFFPCRTRSTSLWTFAARGPALCDEPWRLTNRSWRRQSSCEPSEPSPGANSPSNQRENFVCWPPDWWGKKKKIGASHVKCVPLSEDAITQDVLWNLLVLFHKKKLLWCSFIVADCGVNLMKTSEKKNVKEWPKHLWIWTSFWKRVWMIWILFDCREFYNRSYRILHVFYQTKINKFIRRKVRDFMAHWFHKNNGIG